MREITKSFLSFTWAMSVLGMKQVGDLLTQVSRGGFNSGRNSVDPVTKIAVSQLDGAYKGIYDCGDNMQKTFVDVSFGALNCNAVNLDNFNPLKPFTDWMNKSVKSATNTTTNPVRTSTVSGVQPPPNSRNDCSTSVADSSGWGPMPGNT
jgi:hypothetical protein